MVRCLVSLSVLFSGTLAAAPIDRKVLPANVRQVVHIDIDQIHKSQWLMSSIDALLAKNAQIKQFLKRVPKDLVFLKNARLHDLTVYTNHFPKVSTIAIISAKADWASLRRLVERESSYLKVTYRKRTIHHWTYSERQWAKRLGLPNRKEEGEQTTHYLSVVKPGVFVFSDQLRGLVEALDTMDGRRPCVDKATFKKLLRFGPRESILRFANLNKTDKNTTLKLEQIVVWADERIHLAGQLDAKTEPSAAMYLSFVNPNGLAGLIGSLAPKGNKKTVEKIVDLGGKKKKKKKPTGRLSITMQFNGRPMKDVKKAVECILQCIKVKREKSRLVFTWSSYAALSYEYRDEGEVDDHRFTFKLSVKEPTRVANSTKSKTKKR